MSQFLYSPFLLFYLGKKNIERYSDDIDNIIVNTTISCRSFKKLTAMMIVVIFNKKV